MKEQASPTPPACPLCGRTVPASRLFNTQRLDPQILAVLLDNCPGWRPDRGLCPDCAARFIAAWEELRLREPARAGCRILPIALRLGASREFSGRGVTIAFLDAGFYLHPDLVGARSRILAYTDVTRRGARFADLRKPDVSAWHGMMTSVVACGNGALSDGLYRGLAWEADLVLVKCGTAKRIPHDDIRKGLDWVVKNRKRYGIRIVNVSCGGDYEASYLDDALSQSAERATREGILVCAAAGNAGQIPNHPVLPPASAPSVLTVGGLDDKNRLDVTGYDMYHSSYGPTLDGLQKPEVLAPGIWVAAPILPGTPTAEQARLLTALGAARDGDLKGMIAEAPGVDPSLDAAASLDPYLIRQLVESRLRDNNVISGAYKHVDGTSFSSPIVSSVAAQMLEANPALSGRAVKRILMDTATRMPQVPVERQGWGVVNPRLAVEAALSAARATEPAAKAAR